MVVHGDAAMGVVEHGLIDFVGTTGNRFHESAAADDGIELQGDVLSLEFVDDQLLAEGKLVDDVLELAEFFGRMAYGAQQDGLLVVVDGNLGRCGARVDG